MIAADKIRMSFQEQIWLENSQNLLLKTHSYLIAAKGMEKCHPVGNPAVARRLSVVRFAHPLKCRGGSNLPTYLIV